LDAGLGRNPETTGSCKDRSKSTRPDITKLCKSSEREEGGRNSLTDSQREERGTYGPGWIKKSNCCRQNVVNGEGKKQ
jgi:hypothetical protein